MCSETANKISCIKTSIQFIKEGNVSKTPHRNNRHKPTLLDGCTDWRIITDVDRQLAFPTEITSTRQRPDLIIWSVNSKKVIAELTIPFQANIDWEHQRKLEKNEDLRELCTKNGWSTDIFPLKIGCRGFISNSTSIFFNQTRTFTSREEGIYKKDPKQDCNCI